LGNLGFFYIANSIIISQDNPLVFSLPDVKNIAYFDLVSRISEALALPEEKIDILFFDLQEADPDILPKTGGSRSGYPSKNRTFRSGTN